MLSLYENVKNSVLLTFMQILFVFRKNYIQIVTRCLFEYEAGKVMFSVKIRKKRGL